MERLTGHFELDVRTLDALLGVERCFDMIARDLVAGGRRCRLYVVDGYGDDAVLERMIGFWLALPSTADAADAQTFIDRYVTFSEVNAEADLRQTATAVFLGKTLLLAEGYGECILIDAKSYPPAAWRSRPRARYCAARTTASSKRSCRTRRSCAAASARRS